jgi:folate-dependent phosphoribosylglycinamide formyltransferase PurN
VSARPRAVVLTSTFLRHQHLVNRACERLEVVGVWQERKAFEPLSYAENSADEGDISRHFAARDRSEADCFAEDAVLRLPAGTAHHVIDPTGCNDPAEVARMRGLSPDVVLVFGTGILRAGLVAVFPGRMLNLHLGLSPYYRGAGTNFWPLVNGEPEYVGATIHYLDEGLDSGPIVSHARAEVRPDDGPHDIGNRTITAAVEVLLHAAVALGSGPLPAAPQEGGGRLYKRKDFSAAAVRRMYDNFAGGMLQDYLDHRAKRDARLALITLPTPSGSPP